MRKSLAVVLCCVAIGCERNAPPPAKGRATTRAVPSDVSEVRVDTVIRPVPVFLDHAIIGSERGADGTVAKENVDFVTGQPVYLTMIFRESPVGLHSRVVWTNAKKKEIRAEERDIKGAKSVTFSLDTKKLKPGVYHVAGYWGGNLATERDFGVGPRKK